MYYFKNINVMAKAQGSETTDLDEINQRLLKGPMKNPSGGMGTPEDIGNLVAFVASPLADFINGTNLRVDGGYVPTVN